MPSKSRFKMPNAAAALDKMRMATAVHIDDLYGRTGIRIAQDKHSQEILWLKDRFRHLYMIGTSGSGKTNLLRQMIEADMRDGFGVGVLAKENDQIVKETLPFVPRERINDTVYLNPTAKHPLCINPLELPKGVEVHIHVAELMSIFSSLLSITAFTQKPLVKSMLTILVTHPEPTLENVADFLDDDPDYRNGLMNEVKHLEATQRAIKYFHRYDNSKTSSGKSNAGFIIDKFEPFLESPQLRKIMCGRTTLSLSEVMQNNGIFIANLSDAGGVLGDAESSLLGAYLLTAIKREMSNRQGIDEAIRELSPFMLYVDEFTKYVAEKSNEEAFAEFLLRARKNFVALHLAHQDTADMSDNLASKIGNAGARVVMNVVERDAPRFARYITLDHLGENVTLSANQITKLTPGECYVALVHEDEHTGHKTKSWHHAQTFLHQGQPDHEVAQQIIDQSSVIQVESETAEKAPDSQPEAFESESGTEPPPEKPEPSQEQYKNTTHTLEDFETP